MDYASLAGLGIVALIAAVLCLAYAVFVVIAGWLFIRKMGRPGWLVFIPYAQTYVSYSRCWKIGAFWRYIVAYVLFVITSLILTPVAEIMMASGDITAAASIAVIIGAVIFFASAIMLVVNYIRLNAHISRAFGRGFGFTLGLLFLPGIFALILGFSKKVQYIGKGE